MTPLAPSAAGRALVAEHCGPAARWHRVVTTTGRAQVWRVDDAMYLKEHASTAAFDRELLALEQWCAELDHVPVLVAHDPASSLLLITAQPGRVVAGAGAGAEVSPEVSREAGAWLRRLHGLAVPTTEDTDDMALRDALIARFEAAARRLSSLVDPALVDRARRRVAHAAVQLTDVRRVPCHGDFTPHNWLVDAAGAVSVVDFEHARLDAPHADVARLATTVWLERPELREPFWDGWGRDLAVDVDVVHGFALVEALGTIAWARQHGDMRLEETGQAALAVLLSR